MWMGCDWPPNYSNWKRQKRRKSTWWSEEGKELELCHYRAETIIITAYCSSEHVCLKVMKCKIKMKYMKSVAVESDCQVIHAVKRNIVVLPIHMKTIVLEEIAFKLGRTLTWTHGWRFCGQSSLLPQSTSRNYTLVMAELFSNSWSLQ